MALTIHPQFVLLQQPWVQAVRKMMYVCAAKWTRCVFNFRPGVRNLFFCAFLIQRAHTGDIYKKRGAFCLFTMKFMLWPADFLLLRDQRRPYYAG